MRRSIPYIRLRAIENAHRSAVAGPSRASLLRVCLWLLAVGVVAIALICLSEYLPEN